MTDIHKDQLDRQFDQLSGRLPRPFARFIDWIRRPSSTWVRWPVAILFILGGLVGFLPILGFWMVPVGLMLLAQDVPFLRPPIARALAWGQRTWEGWRRRRARR